MNILTRMSRQGGASDNSRRAFVWKIGAGVSAALVPAVVRAAGAEPGEALDPALRAAFLEEERRFASSIRTFEQAMDKGLHEEVIGMFTDDAEVVFNGGVFKSRSHGVSRLYRDRFPAGKTGRRMEPAPGFELTADDQSDSVQVSPDRRSGDGRVPYSIQVGMPFETETSLAAMARLHGEGVRTWWEGGVYRVNYRKDVGGRLEDQSARIRHAVPRGLSLGQELCAADFRCRLSTRFPADQQGPDELLTPSLASP